MSEKNKVIDSTQPIFITMTVTDWVDLFIRSVYISMLFVYEESAWTNSSYRAYTDDITEALNVEFKRCDNIAFLKNKTI